MTENQDLQDYFSNRLNSIGRYQDVQKMFDDMYEHMTVHSETSEESYQYQIHDNPSELTVGFKCSCGQEFLIGLTKVKKSDYSKYFGPSENRHKIAYILSDRSIEGADMLNDFLTNFDKFFSGYQGFEK